MEKSLALKNVYKMISEKNYDAALFELRKIGYQNKVGSDENFHYLNALIHTKLGSITLARHHLMCIENQTKITRVHELSKKLQEIEPVYIVLAAKFNNSIDLIKEKDFENAHEALRKVFSKVHLFPFPLQWYKTFYLVKLTIGSGDLQKWVNQLPTHIKSNQEIMQIIEAATPKKLVDNTTSAKKKRFNPWFVYGGAVVVIATSLALSLSFFQLSELDQVSEKIKAPSNIENEEEAKSIPKLSVEIKELVEEDSTEERVEFNSVYPKLTTITARAFHIEGYQQYQAGNYSDAVLNFKPVIEGEKKEYYTDDSHYYLILSLFEIGKFEESLDESRRFVKEQDDHYKLSPYWDAVHLKSAEALMELQRASEAKLELKKIIESGQEDWVINKATSILKEINNGN